MIKFKFYPIIKLIISKYYKNLVLIFITLLQVFQLLF